MEPRFWLAAAAIVFLALWGWRELAVRALRERIASRDAEISRLSVENDRLSEQLKKAQFEVGVLTTAGTKSFTVNSKQGSVRIYVSPQGRGVAIVENLPTNTYQLSYLPSDQLKMQDVAAFDVPPAGVKTISLDHLPKPEQIKSFAITAR
jgi:hypothetical protein